MKHEQIDRGVPPGYELLSPLDQDTVRELVVRGADMRQPRDVHHALYFPSAEAAARASRVAENAGWRASSSDPEGDGDRWTLTCERDHYVLLARLIHADSQFFDTLARRGGGEHGGWEASVN